MLHVYILDMVNTILDFQKHSQLLLQQQYTLMPGPSPYFLFTLITIWLLVYHL